MAAKLVNAYDPDNIDTLLYVKLEKHNQVSFHGFKKVYLAQELSSMECDFLSCSKCLGISRDAISSEGEILCELCKEGNSSSNPAQKVRNSVVNLNIKCPLLRDCDWNGKLVDGWEHLKECGRSLITCPLECDDVIKRREMSDHLKTECLLREIKCEFCDLVVIFKNLSEHLETCPAHPVVCKCSREIRRDEVEEHIDKDCELTEIECPYAKYNCKIGKIPRESLLAHKREFYIEHQDMIEHENCLLKDKLETYNSEVLLKHDLMMGNYNELKEKNDHLVRKHNLLVGRTKTKSDKSVQKHDLLDVKCDKLKEENIHLAEKHDLLERKCNILKQENSQLVQKHRRIESNYSKLKQELKIRKQLLGVTVQLDLNSEIAKSSEFTNGQYKFVCNISFSVAEVRISLDRFPTSTYSDKKVLCITECVVCLQETTTEVLPHFVSERVCSRIETRGTIPIMRLDKEVISRYRQPDGIVKMGVYFDYDCVAYRGLFS